MLDIIYIILDIVSQVALVGLEVFDYLFMNFIEAIFWLLGFISIVFYIGMVGLELFCCIKD
jgi:hypothetical protein